MLLINNVMQILQMTQIKKKVNPIHVLQTDVLISLKLTRLSFVPLSQEGQRSGSAI